jgi:glycosyltransferase involved in cell wall biosynthesis
MSDVMRILMVTARYQPFIGGIETHVREVGWRMAAAGHQVTVVTTDPTGALAETQWLDGMSVVRVKAWPRGRDYFISPGVFAAISRHRAWDIIHFQGYNTFVAPIGMAAAIRHQIPFVLTFHSGGHSSSLRNALRGLQALLLAPAIARARRLIAVSEFEADLFSRRLRLDRQRFTVVPNGASLPALAAPLSAGRQPLILSVGRLERYKGHQRVLAAFGELLARRPEARLQIVGSGPYERNLRTLIRALGIEERVKIGAIGAADRQLLTQLFMQAGLVVLLSEYEAHPVSVMEALSLGCRVLVSDTSGLSELARKGLCRAVPLNATPSAVAAAMAEELAAPPQRANVDLPDWDACTRALLDIYESSRAAGGDAPLPVGAPRHRRPLPSPGDRRCTRHA